MTVLVAAGATALGIALVLAASALVRADDRRRREALLADVADGLATASRRLARALDRIGGIRAGELRTVRGDLTLVQVLEGVLEGVLERTGADAAALSVEGASGTPVTAFRGEGVDAAVLESTITAIGHGPYRTATVRWRHEPSGGVGGEFRAASVAPVLEDERMTGSLVAYASSEAAFGPADEQTLRMLADELATRLETARGYDRLELRHLRDPDTGIRNRDAYEIDLEREIARARSRHGPLSLVLVELDSSEGRLGDQVTLHLVGIARALTRASRGSDFVYRRRSRQLALMLPGTGGAGAGAVAARLETEARAAVAGATRGTIAVAAVEWRPAESMESLDARATAALEAALRTPVAATDAITGS